MEIYYSNKRPCLIERGDYCKNGRYIGRLFEYSLLNGTGWINRGYTVVIFAPKFEKYSLPPSPFCLLHDIQLKSHFSREKTIKHLSSTINNIYKISYKYKAITSVERAQNDVIFKRRGYSIYLDTFRSCLTPTCSNLFKCNVRIVGNLCNKNRLVASVKIVFLSPPRI